MSTLAAVLLAALVTTPNALAGPVEVQVELRNDEGEKVLNKILADEGFWADAWTKTYDDKLYDEIRLKDSDSGYVPMITGEGGQDFPHDVVADIVFYQNTRLPKYMSGAKAVVLLGSGFDKEVGAEYRDCFYVLDLTVFYGTFPQRMYRKHDAENNVSVMWFEKMDERFVDADTWAKYSEQMTKTVDAMDRRWPPFNSVVPVGDLYGMFMVSPGEEHTSRVSFITKIGFGDDAGFVARWGSQMPGVIKSGLRSGFGASVAIAEHENERRQKKEATP
jgi:hypothetical protein